jgi:MoaA/NifB/PqqE/SkfB family radical SAM enzyme
MQSFIERITELEHPEWLCTSETLSTLQVNIGSRCNLRCKHCHIQASPERTEEMSRATLEACLRVFAREGFTVLDVTGGAPEMHPEYRWFIDEAAQLVFLRNKAKEGDCDSPDMLENGKNGEKPRPEAKIITRTNLAILTEPGYGDLPAFWAERGVEVACSLPSWGQRGTDRQRGDGVFERAIEGLRLLNAVGFGMGSSAGASSDAGTSSDAEVARGASQGSQPLTLNIVVNPGGAFLPPAQQSAEREFRQKLAEGYGVSFDNLLTITNNPTGRFGALLAERGTLDGYMRRLSDAFNPATVANMMCRSQISVAWDGRLFDCDFNQTLDWPLEVERQKTIFDVEEWGLKERPLRLGDHCYACTAGAGSSCGGATDV